MKIAFYLPNAGVNDVPYRDLEKGNPGLGGTEYIILVTALLVSRQIKEKHIKDIELIVAAQKIPPGLDDIYFVQVKDFEDVLTLGMDYVFFKYANYFAVRQIMQSRKAAGKRVPKLVAWAHNMIDRKERNIIDHDEDIVNVLCVSREQMNLYRDHHLFLKSSYLYNGMPVSFLKKEKDAVPPLKSRPHEVTSVGSIDYYKGFHLIAKAWKTVLKEFPDARLNVIGTGNLYDKNSKLGKYGIAEESYENSFMPYLTDEKGEILPSVKFHGLMGVEKNEVLKRTCVGIPSPMGKETFCLVALEMQAMGALVTTMNYGGFRNTVYKTGKLYQDTDQLADCIIALMKESDNDLDGCYQWMEENFSYERVAERWIAYLLDLQKGEQKTGTAMLPYDNVQNDYLEALREHNRRIKAALPWGYNLPTIEFYRSILRRLGLVKGW